MEIVCYISYLLNELISYKGIITSALAETGSGKTLAFGLPLIQKIHGHIEKYGDEPGLDYFFTQCNNSDKAFLMATIKNDVFSTDPQTDLKTLVGFVPFDFLK